MSERNRTQGWKETSVDPKRGPHLSEGHNTEASKVHWRHQGRKRITTGPFFRGTNFLQDGDQWAGQVPYWNMVCGVEGCGEKMGVYDERDAIGSGTDYTLARWNAKYEGFFFPDGSQSGGRLAG